VSSTAGRDHLTMTIEFPRTNELEQFKAISGILSQASC